jgi:hypothetical protein
MKQKKKTKKKKKKKKEYQRIEMMCQSEEG